MALYLFNLTCLSRGKGTSGLRKSAYINGEKLYNERDGTTHDFTHKKDIVYRKLLLPVNALPEFGDHQIFWNAVERAEKRKDSRTAKEIVLGLQREFSLTTSIALVEKFVCNCILPMGMCADIAIHAGHKKNSNDVTTNHDITSPHNPHCHILITDRPLDKNGFCDKKNPDWNDNRHLKKWREEWDAIQNKEFTLKGLDVKDFSHKSYKERGIDKKPTRHLGPVVSRMKERGLETRLIKINRDIEKENELKRLQQNQKREQEQTRKQSLER